MGGIAKGIFLVFTVLSLLGCAALNWPKPDAPRKMERKTLSLPSQDGNGQNGFGSTDTSIVDALVFFTELQSIPAKERAAQLSLARARYTEESSDQHRLEFIFALLALEKSSEKRAKHIKKLLSEFDQTSVGEQAGTGLPAIVYLLDASIKEPVKRNPAPEKNVELSKALEERDEEIARLQEQINALKKIEQSIHQREVENITDGK